MALRDDARAHKRQEGLFAAAVAAFYLFCFAAVAAEIAGGANPLIGIAAGGALIPAGLLCVYLRAFRGFWAVLPGALLAVAPGAAALLRTGGPEAFAVSVYGAFLLLALLLLALLAGREGRRRARLEWLSERDDLTGIYNGRYFQEKLEEAVARAERDGSSVSLCIVDIDHFKSINDQSGHHTGDVVLRQTAELITSGVRSTDIVCRYGGDEFAVIFPETDEYDILTVTENISKRCAAPDDRRKKRVTLSIGCSTYPAYAHSKTELFEQADRALYLAKDEGRGTSRSHRDVTERGGSIARRREPLAKEVRALFSFATEQNGGLCERSERAAGYAVMIGRALGLAEDQLRLLEAGGLLRDIGRAEISHRIWAKRLPLTAWEQTEIRKHPEYGAAMLTALSELGRIAEDVRHHHERFDGRGYPDGLKGEAIPLRARVLAVADAYEAMTTDRPYRGRMASDEAVWELLSNSGSQFDPKIVDAFLRELAHTRRRERGEDEEEDAGGESKISDIKKAAPR